MVCNYLSPDYNESASFLFSWGARQPGLVDNTRIHVFLPWLNEPLQIHFHPIEMNAMKYASLLYNHFRRFSHIFRSYFLCLDSILLFSVEFVYVFFSCTRRTYPISGLALPRSWLFAQVIVTLLSVTLTTRGVPGIDGNVLGSGVRCKFTLPLFSTWKQGERNKTRKYMNDFGCI